GLLQRVAEERAADRVRAAGDRADDGSEEAEVLHRAGELGPDRRDRLPDVARLELRQLLAVGLDGVGQRVQKPGALVRRRLAPGPVQRGPRGFAGAVAAGLAANGGARERLSGSGLVQVTDLAGGGLHHL